VTGHNKKKRLRALTLLSDSKRTKKGNLRAQQSGSDRSKRKKMMRALQSGLDRTKEKDFAWHAALKNKEKYCATKKAAAHRPARTELH
jgi:hypothetical protein